MILAIVVFCIRKYGKNENNGNQNKGDENGMPLGSENDAANINAAG